VAQGFEPASGGVSDRGGTSWGASGESPGASILQLDDALDLTRATGARLLFDSWLDGEGAAASVQASADGAITWTTIVWIDGPSRWRAFAVDLSEMLGAVVHVRFVFDAGLPVAAVEPAAWQLRDIHVEADPD
jgi:hypothetical protein